MNVQVEYCIVMVSTFVCLVSVSLCILLYTLEGQYVCAGPCSSKIWGPIAHHFTSHNQWLGYHCSLNPQLVSGMSRWMMSAPHDDHMKGFYNMSRPHLPMWWLIMRGFLEFEEFPKVTKLHYATLTKVFQQNLGLPRAFAKRNTAKCSAFSSKRWPKICPKGVVECCKLLV